MSISLDSMWYVRNFRDPILYVQNTTLKISTKIIHVSDVLMELLLPVQLMILMNKTYSILNRDMRNNMDTAKFRLFVNAKSNRNHLAKQCSLLIASQDYLTHVRN